MTTLARQTTINLRAPRASRSLIDHAASVTGKSRTEFMLEAACEKARQVLLDRTVFSLNPSAFRRFEEILEAPAPDAAAVKRLLRRRAPWETGPR